MKDYRRLKTGENSRQSLNWNLNREISKQNYRIHTDAIKENLLPSELPPLRFLSHMKTKRMCRTLSFLERPQNSGKI